MSVNVIMVIWLLGFLILWLSLEMSGVMATARTDIVDGDIPYFLVMACWPIVLFLGIVLVAPVLLVVRVYRKVVSSAFRVW